MNTRQTKAVDAVEEAKALLHGLGFASSRGVYIRGARSSVTVATSPGLTADSHRIHVACYMPGSLEVEWSGVAIFLEAEDTRDFWLAFLDPSGKAVFNVGSAPERYYTLSSSVTAAELVGMSESVSLGPDKEPSPETAIEIPSVDGLVRAIVGHSGGIPAVEFHTDHARVARDRIHLSVSDQGGSTLLNREGSFEASPPGGWAAHFELEPGIPPDAIFRFAVVAPRR